MSMAVIGKPVLAIVLAYLLLNNSLPGFRRPGGF
nr:hypothetical protein [Paenibacillus elgii]